MALSSALIPSHRGWFASLPQYDISSLRAATDAWWAGIAHHMDVVGISDPPRVLTRSADAEADWRRSDLLMTQTCGYPLMMELRGHLRALASPIYACEGCDGPRYSSAIIVRADDPAEMLEDLRGRRAAANNPNSHSGMNVLRHMVAPLATKGRFFSDVIWSGGHILSMAAVRDDRADVAAIDSVTYALAKREYPDLAKGVRILDWTPPAVSLPYAVRHDASQDLRQAVLAALMAAAADPRLAGCREALLIDGFVASDDSDYQIMPDWAAKAAKMGYPELA